MSVADFPSEYGHFRIIGVVNNRDRKDHTIVLRGDIGDGENVLTRIHSACLTGEALGSRRCDCGPQLREALAIIEREGRGIVLYHMEEGRGIGLVNKLRAYALQDAGIDTWDANVMLGFKADARSYEIPAAMMKRLGIKSVRLMTNNPEKVAELEKYGIRVAERVHHELPAHHHDRRYLETKKGTLRPHAGPGPRSGKPHLGGIPLRPGVTYFTSPPSPFFPNSRAMDLRLSHANAAITMIGDSQMSAYPRKSARLTMPMSAFL